MQWGHSRCSRCWCKKVNSQCIQQIWVVGTVTFSARRSTHSVGHAVDVVGAVNMGGGGHLGMVQKS